MWCWACVHIIMWSSYLQIVSLFSIIPSVSFSLHGSCFKTIAICVMYTIYMNYIFIHDTHSRGIASLSLPAQDVVCPHFFQMKSAIIHDVCVALYFPHFTFTKSSFGSNHVVGLTFSKKWYSSHSFEQKKRGYTSFAPVRECKREGKCIFSSHVIIVAR